MRKQSFEVLVYHSGTAYPCACKCWYYDAHDFKNTLDILNNKFVKRLLPASFPTGFANMATTLNYSLNVQVISCFPSQICKHDKNSYYIIVLGVLSNLINDETTIINYRRQRKEEIPHWNGHFRYGRFRHTDLVIIFNASYLYFIGSLA